MKKYIIGATAGLAFCLAGVALASGDTFAASNPYVKGGVYVGAELGYGYLGTPEDMYPSSGLVLPASWDVIPGVTWNSDFDKGDMVWGIHVGYDFHVTTNSLVGIEVGYRDLGESSYGAKLSGLPAPAVQPAQDNGYTTYVDGGSLSKNIDEQLFDLLITGHYYVWKGFNVFGKVGVAYVESTNDQTATYETVSTDDPLIVHEDNFDNLTGKESIWRFAPEYALGLGYTFTQNFNAYLMYDHVCGVDPDSLDHLSKSVVYGSDSVMIGLEYKF